MKTSEKLIAGVGGVVLAVAATFSGIAIANPPGPVEDSPAKIVQEEPKTVDLEPEVTPEPTEEPIEPAPAPAPEPVEPAPAPAPPPPPAPTKCPSGTIAGQVDGAGNESNCQATNNGQPCVEYNDANECVAWYKP